jgi:RNA polymerase sigma-70 factor (ECF subfamily)
MDHDITARPGRNLSEIWGEDRAHLLRLAERLLRDPAESEDVVQEAFGRLANVDIDQIDDVRGWLAVVVRRLCLDRLRSARSRRESTSDLGDAPVTERAPMQSVPAIDPADRVTLDEQLQMALAVVLDRLSPAERTSFVLHDVFGFPFDDVAEIVGRTPAACRQLASRARRSIREGAPPDRATTPSPEYQHVTDRFIAASKGGDLSELMAVLDPNVTGHASIVGGRSLAHVEGREAVLEQLVHRFGPGTGRVLRATAIERNPALLVFDADHVYAVVVLDVTDGIVTSIRSYVRPR